MDKEKETKAEPKTEDKKSSKGRVWMYIWLASTFVYVLSFTNVLGALKGTLSLLSFLVGVISLIVWAFKSRAGRRVILYGICLLFLFFVFYLLIARPQKMNGEAMSPTIKNGDCVWSEKISYYIHKPRRGDVVFAYNQATSSDMITRIIGLPNETISYKPGEFKINGSVLNEPHINWGNLASLSSNWPEVQITLKDNEYLGFSDNQAPTDSKEITTDQSVLQNVLQKFLQDSTFTMHNISGRATSIKYSCN